MKKPFWFLPLSLALGAASVQAQTFNDFEQTEVDDGFNEVSTRAEAAFEAYGPFSAIQIYEESLLNGEAPSRVHLRLGQLFQQIGQNTDAAIHYRDCFEDDSIDPMDRELICQHGYISVTSNLNVVFFTPGAQLIILEPDSFAGPWSKDKRLPLNTNIKVSVESPGHEPQTSEFWMTPNLTWEAQEGRSILSQTVYIPEGYTYADKEYEHAQLEKSGIYTSDMVIKPWTPPKWSVFLTAGVGLALVGTGLAVGFSNQGTLDNIRNDQLSGACGKGFCTKRLNATENTSVLADSLWISGAGISAIAAALAIWCDWSAE